MRFHRSSTQKLWMFSGVLFLWCLCGCSSLPTRIVHSDPSRNIWLARSGEIFIDKAFFSEGKLFFKCQSFYPETDVSYTFYGSAQWDPSDVTGLYNGAAVFITLHQKREWEAMIPKDALPVASVSLPEWQHLRSLLLNNIDGSHKLSAEDVERKTRDFLKQDLAQKGLSFQKVLVPVIGFDVSQKGPAFIFMDLEKEYGLGLFFSEPRDFYKSEELKKSIRTTDYAVLDSYVFGLATRPFSYAFRLIKWSQDMVYDTVTMPSGLFQQENTQVPPISDGEGMDLDAFEKFLDKATGRKAQKGTMKFLIDGEPFFLRLVDEINTAHKSIDIRLFIFDNDDYAVQIADLLKKKSREGVKVRVLLDGMGQLMGEGKSPDGLPEGFVPPYSMVSYLKKNSHVEVRIRPNALFKADHTKTITMDNRVCFLGGMNIGREYRYLWHDMMVEVNGPVLNEVIKEFDLAWAHAGAWGDLGYVFKKLFYRSAGVSGEGYPVRLLYTRIDDAEIFRVQLEAIRRAKRYIWINNAYFSDNTFLYELVAARRRGVDVRVILPAKGNHGIMNKSNAITANILFRNGIDVYFYPGMSHVKAALYDGWLCTGSANFDKLSLRDNLEMNIATSDPQTVGHLKKDLFGKDFSSSRKMAEPVKTGLGDVVAEIIAERL